jgi:hypothetical protein
VGGLPWHHLGLESDLEGGSLAEDAVYLNLASHLVNNFLADAQTKTSTLIVHVFVKSGEICEKFFLIFFFYAHSSICDLNSKFNKLRLIALVQMLERVWFLRRHLMVLHIAYLLGICWLSLEVITFVGI